MKIKVSLRYGLGVWHYTNFVQPLDKTVINRIAAGEIIIAPANALKEMLENSIDAGATNIEIIVKEGGVKLLQITDNGTGIEKEDMPILCQRFTTSKLVNFEDLNNLTTYGFRGEALASISHIAHVAVTTKTESSQCGWKAFYSDGELIPAKPSESSKDPKPVASKKGTQITVEDFFYNVPSRLRALKSSSEEFSKILDVIGRYSVHTAHVGFICKKFGDSHYSIATRPNIDIKERIRIVFGNDVAKNLIPIEMDSIEQFGVLNIKGQITNPNYNNKKSIQPVFFINNRLISNDTLKRAIISSINHFLPKGHKPFIYLSLEIKPQNLDVNVHPTKREVRFLNEDEIIDKICIHITNEFNKIDSSRNFQTKSLPIQPAINNAASNNPYKKAKYNYNLVRTDSAQAKITTFLPKTTETESSLELAEVNEFKYIKRDKIEVNLQSISELKDEVKLESSRKLTEIFSSILYIGIIDESRRLIAIQYDVKLMLMDFSSVLFEFFYQVGLRNFSNFGIIHLNGTNEELNIKNLLSNVYNNKEINPAASIEQIIENLINFKEMLLEYFSIEIEQVNENIFILKSIPLLLKNYLPSLSKLPIFLYKLGLTINFNDEKTCLKNILKQISLLNIPDSFEQSDSLHDTDPNKQILLSKYQQLNENFENILIPSLKKNFLPPKNLEFDLVEIANLPGLYKVFERC